MRAVPSDRLSRCSVLSTLTLRQAVPQQGMAQRAHKTARLQSNLAGHELQAVLHLCDRLLMRVLAEAVEARLFSHKQHTRTRRTPPTTPPPPPPPLAGAYVVLPQRTMSIVAPDLSKCQLKPYVAGKSLPRGQRVPVWGGADKAEGGAGQLR